MITEDRLRAALEQAAESFKLPADGAERIVAAAVEPHVPERRRPIVQRPRLVLAVGVVVGAVVIGLVTTRSSPDRTPTLREAAKDQSPTTVPTVTAEAASGLTAAPAAGAVANTSGDLPAITAASGTATNNSAATVTNHGAPAALTKIVKEGAIELEVADGRVETAMTRLQVIAAGAGGMVSDSKSTEADNNPTGVVTLRIPADQFDAATAQVRRLGKVRNASSSATDVTAEYTDNAARLKSLTATRESLLQVLSNARAIGDILAVRDRITDNQTQIEQLQGRQQVLDNQVALSTLTVSVNEPGVARTQATHRSAWDRAVDGFISTWSSILAHAGAVIAVLIAMTLLIAALYLSGGWVRRAYVRRRA